MISIIDGDLLETDCTVIAHQVNCVGLMEHGVAKQIRDKFPDSYTAYLGSCRLAENLGNSAELLGLNVMCSEKYRSSDKIIVNMFAQLTRGTGLQTNYTALQSCLTELKSWAEREHYYSIAMPYKIGCGLAGGDWNIVYPMLESLFASSLIHLKLYRLERNERYEEDIVQG